MNRNDDTMNSVKCDLGSEKTYDYATIRYTLHSLEFWI